MDLSIPNRVLIIFTEINHVNVALDYTLNHLRDYK